MNHMYYFPNSVHAAMLLTARAALLSADARDRFNQPACWRAVCGLRPENAGLRRCAADVHASELASDGGCKHPHSTALRALLASCVCLILASCQTPLVSSGRGHSEYGDRAGPQGFNTVIVDAGHGGKDSGAPGRQRGIAEKTIALDIAKKLQRELSGSFKTVMTRSSDTFVPLDSRVAIANRSGDAVLVSIHLNDGSRRLSGPEAYWWRSDSCSLATRVNSKLKSVATGSNNRGLVRRRLRLTRNPDIPCILVECGYLSNARDADLLADAGYRGRVAKAIAQGIRDQAACGDCCVMPKPIYAKPSSAHDARE